MYLAGKITGFDGSNLTIAAPFCDEYLLRKQGINDVEVRLLDGRTRSTEQVRKVYALLRDISQYTGYAPEEVKELLKYNFMIDHDAEYFSMHDVDMTTAREFITYLIDFCLEWDVPCQDRLLNLAEDISRYLYMCLAHRKCAICGAKADVHHVDAVGMGRDRDDIIHIGMRAIALCREHHIEIETIGNHAFFEKYHVYGIELDEWLCNILNLNMKSR